MATRVSCEFHTKVSFVVLNKNIHTILHQCVIFRVNNPEYTELFQVISSPEAAKNNPESLPKAAKNIPGYIPENLFRVISGGELHTATK